jgi:hypothetical protein
MQPANPAYDPAPAANPGGTIGTEDGGRLATDCVRPEKDQWGRNILKNRCGAEVSVGLCVEPDCARDSGGEYNVADLSSINMGEGQYHWGACYGKNTIHGVPGSKGQRFRCTAPL